MKWIRHRLLTLRFRDHMRKRAEFIAIFGTEMPEYDRIRWIPQGKPN